MYINIEIYINLYMLIYMCNNTEIYIDIYKHIYEVCTF